MSKQEEVAMYYEALCKKVPDDVWEEAQRIDAEEDDKYAKNDQ